MKAVVWYGVGDIRVEDVPEPKIQDATDAIVKLTASAICGTDLHFIRGTVPGMKRGTILGHEGVGIVEKVGKDVRNLSPGDRVIVPSTIACGTCVYCRAGYYSQCDRANPNGPSSGTAFYGGPKESGPFDGMQAEKVRVPFANVGLVRIPPHVTDEQAILLSDIFPTGWFGAECAEVTEGDTVAVFGCGPVGQFAIASAKLMGAGRVFAVDRHASRLDMARAQGAEVIHFDREDPVETLKRLTNGIGVDRAIDAVGVDAELPQSGPAARKLKKRSSEFEEERKKIAPRRSRGELWQPGSAPSLVLEWCVEALAKAGSLGVIGVYSGESKRFPIGDAVEKNLTIRMGNCPHRRYIPDLLEMVAAEVVDPSDILTQTTPILSAIEAYESFDQRDEGWVKVMLEP